MSGYVRTDVFGISQDSANDVSSPPLTVLLVATLPFCGRSSRSAGRAVPTLRSPEEIPDRRIAGHRKAAAWPEKW
jgi:hypothetical protein